MKKKHPEHVNLERWLVSYADFITLLFAFFVIMYALAQSDKAKFAAVASSIRKAFGAGPVGMVNLGGNSGGSTANPFEVLEAPGGRVLDLPAGKTNTAGDADPKLQEIKELLEETISLELGATDVSEKIQMQFDSRGLIIRVAAKDFFEEGEIEPRVDVRPIIDRIGKVLNKTNRMIRIEGHTDRLEIKSQDASIDLSGKRSAWVMKYLINKFNIDKQKIGFAGYAHFRPLTKGSEPWNRSKNRRVEIIVLNNSYEVP